MEHTKGPWIVTGDGTIRYIESRIGNGWMQEVATCMGTEYGDMEANARRIVACVNACEGIPSDNVLFTNVGSVRKLIVQQELEIVALKDHRYQLLSSLKSALEWIDAVPSDMQLPVMPGFDRDELDNLIAKIEGAK